MAEEQVFIKRDGQNKIAQHLINQKEITVILGPRQVGKTVLLKQLMEWLVKEQQINHNDVFYFNLDIIQDWEAVKDQTQFINFLKSRSQKQKIYVFVDEAQKVENPGVFYKGVYDSDLNVKLILTGSASLYFFSKIKESLAGRKRIFFLNPFSFQECVSIKNKALLNALTGKENLPDFDKAELNEILNEYLVWGGYPMVVLTSNPEQKNAVLADIYSSYIERDIIGFLKIDDKSKFTKTVKLLASQIGQLVNLGEISTITEIDRRTISRYLSVLEETFVLYQLAPYFNNPRQEIIKNQKVYFLDNGLRNYLLENFQPFNKRIDKGALLENFIFQELFACSKDNFFNLHFWRTKQGAEVDFIIEQGLKITPVEVKTTLKVPKISLGLQSFIKKYKPANGLMVNFSGLSAKATLGTTEVNFLSPAKIKNFIH
ncbi:MAG: ATP-binding protein [bacterium]|nr:ATP-binding protein [bacterium]